MWNDTTAMILADGFIAVLLYLVVIEIGLTVYNAKPVGSYVRDFLVLHPWIELGLALFVGALLGHFFAKGPIPWITHPFGLFT
jgi:hypothetical protein